MHFGYALLVGVGVAALTRWWAARLAGLAYPVLVLVAITATGNHFVLDAAAGALVMGLGLVSVSAVRLTLARGMGSSSPGREGSSRGPFHVDRETWERSTGPRATARHDPPPRANDLRALHRSRLRVPLRKVGGE